MVRVQKAKARFEKMMSRAKEVLETYIDRFQKKGLEYAVEAPIWRGELEECKTVKEIITYMKEFSPKCEYCSCPINVNEDAYDGYHEDCFMAWENDTDSE